jgi:putative Holliday junction resolvase
VQLNFTQHLLKLLPKLRTEAGLPCLGKTAPESMKTPMKTIDPKTETQPPQPPVLAIDLGKKRVGIAVSDALSISITRLEALPRTNWKQMLRAVSDLVRRFDAQTVVIGLPLRLNGSAGDAALSAREIAIKFSRSLSVPVYLQDERLSSVEAEANLRAEGQRKISAHVDSESAAIILRDFLVSDQEKILVQP